MKKLVVFTIFSILVLIFLTPAVNASQENMSDVSGLMELPEMDTTGLNMDIPLIEIDPEIMNATPDWIVLAHDEIGKNSLLDDIDLSPVSATEKTDAKNALKTLWNTYPVKFESAGENPLKSRFSPTDQTVRQLIPIGHVTRISFDRVKNGKRPGDPTIIVLPEAVNQTIKNITKLRPLTSLVQQTATRESSTGGSGRTTGGSSKALSSGNSFSPGLSSSSSHALGFQFSIIIGKCKGISR